MADVRADAQQAVKDVQDVQHRRDGGGPDNAYAKLQEEIQSEKVKLGGTNSQAYKDYVNNVQQELQKAGLLPEMTIEWANANKDILKSNSDDDGRITKDGIDKYQTNAKLYADDGQLDAARQMFSDNLKNDFNSVADDHGGFLGIGTHKAIDDGDLDKALTAQRDLHGVDERTMQLLTKAKDSNGNPVPDAVFNVIDTAAHGGSGDGNVSKNDIDTFVNDKNTDSKLKAMGYTDDQIRDLKDGLSNIRDNWDSQASKQLRGNGDYLTQGSIAKAYGFDDFSKFAATENR